MKHDYRKFHSCLKQTGAGVHPDGPNPNLISKYILLFVSLAGDLIYPIGQIHSEFPHYNELDEIWWGIPGFDSDLISSDLIPMLIMLNICCPSCKLTKVRRPLPQFPLKQKPERTWMLRMIS